MPEAKHGGYVLDECGGACPTQASGRTGTGRPFYFRARHGDWDLWLGELSDPDYYPDWQTEGELIAWGDDDTAGWMSVGQVEAVLTDTLGPALLHPTDESEPTAQSDDSGTG